MSASATDLEASDLSLIASMHPSMKYPPQVDFKFDAQANPIHISSNKTINDLRVLFKAAFERASAGKLELQISVLWNTRDHKKPLAPSDEICKHFRSGESFGVHGEIKLAHQQYRFSVGTRVLCLTGGMNQWDAGTIVELDYRESDWPPGRTVPYLVQIDDGYLTVVPQDVNHLCKKQNPPWWASLLANETVTELSNEDAAELLSMACQGSDIDECNHKGETALLAAITLNWIVGVQALLEIKASVSCTDSKGSGALHRACNRGPSMLGLILEAKANPNQQDIDPDFDPELTSRTLCCHPEHRTALHYSCLEGDLECARLLVQGRADLNTPDGQHKSPLHLAMEENHDSIIYFLLDSRAAVDLCSHSSGMKNTPLMDAAHNGKHTLAGKLLAAGANVNKVGKQDMTALHLAARRGDPKMIKILLEAKADTTLESKCGTALQLATVASKKGNTASTEILQLFDLRTEPSPSGPEAERAALYMD